MPTFDRVVFLLLSGRGSLYILKTSHFSDKYIINIVSHSVACPLIFLIMGFDNEMFLILVHLNLSFFLSWLVISAYPVSPKVAKVISQISFEVLQF